MAEEKEPRVTRASVALSKRFDVHGEQKACSARTGIAQPRLSRIAKGELFPRADEGHRFEDTEEIPVAWWAEPPESVSERDSQSASDRGRVESG